MEPEDSDEYCEQPQEDYIIDDGQMEPEDQNNEIVETNNFNLSFRPYTVLSPDQVLELAQNDINLINDVVCLGKQWALVLLDEFGWNPQACTSAFFSNPDKVKKLCGYTPLSQQTVILDKEKMCDNCTFPRKQFFLLGCGHNISCVECSTDYIIYELSHMNPIAKCMHVDCPTPFLRSSIQYLLKLDKKSKIRYLQALSRKFIKKKKNFKQCVGKDCEMFIYRNDPSVSEVTCTSCGMKFCFDCSEEAHRPSTCQQVKLWKSAIYEHPSTNWLRRYTRMCPHCFIMVERIQGCNQIKCPQPKGCGGEFCYICSQPWKPSHKEPFKCPLFKDKGNSIQRERKIFEMVNRNFSLFISNNHQSEMMRDFLKNFKEIQLDFFEILGYDYGETSFLEGAVSTVLNSCNILKWSYVVSYYQNKNTYIEIFSMQQQFAQKSNDQLYESLVEKIMKFWKRLKPRSYQEQEYWEPINIEERKQVFSQIKHNLAKEAKRTEGYIKAVQSSCEKQLRD